MRYPLLHRYNGPLIGLFLIAALCGIVAYSMEPHHFWFHIFIEVTIAAFTLVLTVIVIEDLLEYRRDRDRKDQWRVVREFTLRRLYHFITSIIRASSMLTPEGLKAYDEFRPVIDLDDEVTPEKLKAFAQFGRKLDDLYSKGDLKLLSKDLNMWHVNSTAKLKEILHHVLPRFLQFAPEHPAMEYLFELEWISLWIQSLDDIIKKPDFPDDSSGWLPMIAHTSRCGAMICDNLVDEQFQRRLGAVT